MDVRTLKMRAFLAIPMLLLITSCGQSGGEKTSGAAASGGGNSATITEGTINDDMIDLSESEGYGVTSTMVEAPAEPQDSAEKPTAEPKPAAKPKADDAKPAPAPELKSDNADAE